MFGRRATLVQPDNESEAVPGKLRRFNGEGAKRAVSPNNDKESGSEGSDDGVCRCCTPPRLLVRQSRAPSCAVLYCVGACGARCLSLGSCCAVLCGMVRCGAAGFWCGVVWRSVAWRGRAPEANCWQSLGKCPSLINSRRICMYHYEA